MERKGWCVSLNTHKALVSREIFGRAQDNLGRGSSDYRRHTAVRRSIFGGIAVCGRCGHALCSCGTVYKGEREKYWFLSCTKQRKDVTNPCAGVRIRYMDLVETVRADLNALLAMSDGQVTRMVQGILRQEQQENTRARRLARREKAQARLLTIDRVVGKLYVDNAEGRLEDDRLRRMVSDLERESAGLKALIAELSVPDAAEDTKVRFAAEGALLDNPATGGLPPGSGRGRRK